MAQDPLEEGWKAAGRRAGTSLPRAHPRTGVLLPARTRLLSNNCLPWTFSFLGAHHWDTLPFLNYDKGLGRHLSHILTLWGLSISMNPQSFFFYKLMRAIEFLSHPHYSAVSSLRRLLIFTWNGSPDNLINSTGQPPACLFMTQTLLPFKWLSVFLNE